MYARFKHISTAHKWFCAAFVLLAFFLIYTAIFSTGVLINSTLQQEQWLLRRPLTGVDCVFHVWAKIGEWPFSLLLTLILGIVCLRLGYKPRVLFYLLLLLSLSVGIEFLGKQLFPQPIPQGLDGGMSALQCPQIDSQPTSMKVMMLMGVWWEAPPVPKQDVLDAQQAATIHFHLDKEPPDYYDYSYPSGHAIRWSFLGAIACWLVWRHMKHRSLRVPRILLMVLALVFAFGGGFAQFYVGVHLTNDLIAGYLIGFSFAFGTIALLIQGTRRVKGTRRCLQYLKNRTL